MTSTSPSAPASTRTWTIPRRSGMRPERARDRPRRNAGTAGPCACAPATRGRDAREDRVADASTISAAHDGSAVAEVGDVPHEPLEELLVADLLERDDVGASAAQVRGDVRPSLGDGRSSGAGSRRRAKKSLRLKVASRSAMGHRSPRRTVRLRHPWGALPGPGTSSSAKTQIRVDRRLTLSHLRAAYGEASSETRIWSSRLVGVLSRTSSRSIPPPSAGLSDACSTYAPVSRAIFEVRPRVRPAGRRGKAGGGCGLGRLGSGRLKSKTATRRRRRDRRWLRRWFTPATSAIRRSFDRVARPFDRSPRALRGRRGGRCARRGHALRAHGNLVRVRACCSSTVHASTRRAAEG